MVRRPLIVSGSFSLSLLSMGVVLLALTGCGTDSTPGTPTAPVGNTDVTLLATSTANNQLFSFLAQIQSLTLTTQAGATVSFTPIPNNYVEFLHLNGEMEPMATVSIPQGTYVSATATMGSAEFMCSVDVPGTLAASTFEYGQVPAASVTVKLPAPISVTGTAMGLSLAMDVSHSYTLGECYSSGGGIISWSITPTFDLAPVTFTNNATNSSNGKLVNLAGLVNSVATGGTAFTVNSPDLVVLSFNTSSATVFQGISGAAALAVGMPVAVDASIQADGTVVANRVSVPDTNLTNLRLSSGPVLQVPNSVQNVIVGSQAEQGALNAFIVSGVPYAFGSSTFAISGGASNASSLPFTASFSAANMVAGQEVSVTSHDASLNGLFTAGSLTLMPQVIDGTVTNVSSSGNFNVYTVQLASYDLFPNLAQQPNQASILSTPNMVTVYADASAQVLAGSPAVGAVARFHGLVFNDGGTLKMDCDEIDSGVTE
jgi:hypothetical protein